MEEQIRFIAAATVALLIGIVVSDIIIFVLFARKKKDPYETAALSQHAAREKMHDELESITTPTEAIWHPISAGKPIPIGMYVDVKDSQEIYTKVKLIKKQPAKWQPAFILHKKLTHWRYTK